MNVKGWDYVCFFFPPSPFSSYWCLKNVHTFASLIFIVFVYEKLKTQQMCLLPNPSASCCCVDVIENLSHVSPSAQQQTQHKQTAFFFLPPLAVNSLHSRDLRATPNQALCESGWSVLRPSPVAHRAACVCAYNSWLLFFKGCGSKCKHV